MQAFYFITRMMQDSFSPVPLFRDLSFSCIELPQDGDLLLKTVFALLCLLLCSLILKLAIRHRAASQNKVKFESFSCIRCILFQCVLSDVPLRYVKTIFLQAVFIDEKNGT